ncbi:AMP-binding enzyme domain-containing protein [Phthorimaea operculella]|nr:AMP-binding enzyme domain-containing protein [Phthorimaea operculella]
MYKEKRVNDSVHWYMDDLAFRVVAESGRPCDRFHLGKIILQGLKDSTDFVLQINAATGETETSGSVLERSIKCAVAMKKAGVQKGDVITLLAPNHLDVAIVYYAALYLGATFSAIDSNAKEDDLQRNLDCDQPKIIFCQDAKLADIQDALEKINHKAEIITFDGHKNKNVNSPCNFAEFINNSGDKDSINHFKPTDFDPETTIACLLSTSGTTGVPKKASITHKNFLITGPNLWSRFYDFPTPTRMALLPAPMQWISTILPMNMSPILRITRLQSSEPSTVQNLQEMINTYKPTFTATSTTMIGNLAQSAAKGQCDLSCFETIITGGGPVSKELLEEVRKVAPKAEVLPAYGFTEACSYFVLDVGPDDSCGKLAKYLEYRLVDIDTQEDIIESNKVGELWVKSPGVFKGYYKNPEATKEALTEDGWYKSGDLFYRDDQWNFYFVDRIKSLIRYKQYMISPAELESVIRRHPGVSDVVVSYVLDVTSYCLSLPVACVVRRPGYNVTAQEIKDIVRENLEDWKQLRGGVVFMEELPVTPTTKVDRKKLVAMIPKLTRE